MTAIINADCGFKASRKDTNRFNPNEQQKPGQFSFQLSYHHHHHMLL